MLALKSECIKSRTHRRSVQRIRLLSSSQVRVMDVSDIGMLQRLNRARECVRIVSGRSLHYLAVEEGGWVLCVSGGCPYCLALRWWVWDTSHEWWGGIEVVKNLYWMVGGKGVSK